MSEFIHDDCCERCPNTMKCYAKGECLREPPLAEVASSCKCSVIAGKVVPNPECPVHVEVVDVRVAPSRSAAPPPNEPNRNEPLTYEQEVHALLWAARANTQELLRYFEAQAKQETGDAKKLTQKCIQWKREDVRRINLLIPQALKRRDEDSAAPPSEREAATSEFDEWWDGVYGHMSAWVNSKEIAKAAWAARAAVPQAAPGPTDELVEAQLSDYDRYASNGEGEAFKCGFRRGWEMAEAAAVPAPGEDDTFIKKVVHFRASCITGSECQDALQELANEAERILRAGATAPPKEQE